MTLLFWVLIVISLIAVILGSLEHSLPLFWVGIICCAIAGALALTGVAG